TKIPAVLHQEIVDLLQSDAIRTAKPITSEKGENANETAAAPAEQAAILPFINPGKVSAPAPKSELFSKREIFKEISALSDIKNLENFEQLWDEFLNILKGNYDIDAGIIKYAQSALGRIAASGNYLNIDDRSMLDKIASRFYYPKVQDVLKKALDETSALQKGLGEGVNISRPAFFMEFMKRFDDSLTFDNRRQDYHTKEAITDLLAFLVSEVTLPAPSSVKSFFDENFTIGDFMLRYPSQALYGQLTDRYLTFISVINMLRDAHYFSDKKELNKKQKELLEETLNSFLKYPHPISRKHPNYDEPNLLQIAEAMEGLLQMPAGRQYAYIKLIGDDHNGATSTKLLPSIRISNSDPNAKELMKTFIGVAAEKAKVTRVIIEAHGNGKGINLSEKSTNIIDIAQMISENMPAGKKAEVILTSCCGGGACERLEELAAMQNISFIILSDKGMINFGRPELTDDNFVQLYVDIIKSVWLGATLIYNGKIYRGADYMPTDSFTGRVLKNLALDNWYSESINKPEDFKAGFVGTGNDISVVYTKKYSELAKNNSEGIETAGDYYREFNIGEDVKQAQLNNIIQKLKDDGLGGLLNKAESSINKEESAAATPAEQAAATMYPGITTKPAFSQMLGKVKKISIERKNVFILLDENNKIIAYAKLARAGEYDALKKLSNLEIPQYKNAVPHVYSLIADSYQDLPQDISKKIEELLASREYTYYKDRFFVITTPQKMVLPYNEKSLVENPITQAEWEDVVAFFKYLNENGIRHGDVSANNLSLWRDSEGKLHFSLIDFSDRVSRIVDDSGHLQQYELGLISNSLMEAARPAEETQTPNRDAQTIAVSAAKPAAKQAVSAPDFKYKGGETERASVILERSGTTKEQFAVKIVEGIRKGSLSDFTYNERLAISELQNQSYNIEGKEVKGNDILWLLVKNMNPYEILLPHMLMKILWLGINNGAVEKYALSHKKEWKEIARIKRGAHHIFQQGTAKKGLLFAKLRLNVNEIPSIFHPNHDYFSSTISVRPIMGSSGSLYLSGAELQTHQYEVGGFKNLILKELDHIQGKGFVNRPLKIMPVPPREFNPDFTKEILQIHKDYAKEHNLVWERVTPTQAFNDGAYTVNSLNSNGRKEASKQGKMPQGGTLLSLAGNTSALQSLQKSLQLPAVNQRFWPYPAIFKTNTGGSAWLAEHRGV
ncbi:MAG: hypothetical protein LBG46_02270, partial [Elusimicrobiota bacterium]|nr:hypothetical protein [Elusimicrobiota bacterium]